MRSLVVFTVLIAASAAVYSQSEKNLEMLVETERAFAKAAADRGTRQAFLEYLADDGVIFQPGPVNGRDFWNASPESTALLSWAPAWADLSSDSEIGYTTGGWEFRPAGANADAAAFGQYITVWQKQADGRFKAVLDVGISHESKEESTSVWTSPNDAGAKGRLKVKAFKPASIHINYAEYKKLLASDVRLYRESKFPFLGKQAALDEISREFENIKNGTESDTKCGGSADLKYCYGMLSFTRRDDSFEKGNVVRIWKFRSGKWRIVIEVFARLPEEK